MLTFQEQFCEFLNSRDINYRVSKNTVGINFSDDVVGTIHTMICFDEDGNIKASIGGYNFCKFDGDLLGKGLMVCNLLNEQFQFFKFYIDKDGDLLTEAVFLFDPQKAVDTCAAYLDNFCKVTREAYPLVMRARWS